MYLLVFVTLIISLLGLYTQVLAVEVSRVASQQSAIAGAMISWHNAAMSMAGSIVKTDQYAYNTSTFGQLASNGCSLTDSAITWTFVTGGLKQCPSPLTYPCPANDANSCQDLGPNKTIQANPVNGTILPGVGTITDSAGGNCTAGLCYISYCQTVAGCNPYLTGPVHLSSDYNVGNYEFYSLLYQDPINLSDVVVTFVTPNTTGANSGFLTLANGNQIALTSGDLVKQLQNAGGKRYLYGTISSLLNTQPVINVKSVVGGQGTPTGSFTYNLPGNFKCTATPCPLDAAIAVVSSPDGL
jgi:hypothetical protein